MDEKRQKCEECSGTAALDNYCGAWVCDDCGHHLGLERCYCGWSLYGESGRIELEQMGETIEPDGDW